MGVVLVVGVKRIIDLKYDTPKAGIGDVLKFCALPVIEMAADNCLNTKLGVLDIELRGFMIAEIADGVMKADIPRTHSCYNHLQLYLRKCT